LVLLVGVFLAIVAFIAVLLIRPTDGGGGPEPTPTTAPTVIATADIPLGARITEDKVTVQDKPLDGRDVDAFGDVSQVLGKTVREPVVSGAAITARTLSGGRTGQIDDIQVPPGQRAITVQVDQVTGVGTVIKTGDYVDMVVGIRADKFPVITTNPVDDTFTVVSGINGTSVKLLLQGMQVLGTLLPPPVTAEGQAPSEEEPNTGLTGQQEIVILAVTPQQAEVIKFTQLDASMSLVLRAPEDFRDVNGDPIVPDLAGTTGVTLKILVDEYDVLIPQLGETVLPAQETP
jgi:pilus assembly protein CpaB